MRLAALRKDHCRRTLVCQSQASFTVSCVSIVFYWSTMPAASSVSTTNGSRSAGPICAGGFEIGRERMCASPLRLIAVTTRLSAMLPALRVSRPSMMPATLWFSQLSSAASVRSNRLLQTLEWLTDNGSCFVAARRAALLAEIGLEYMTTPVEGPLERHGRGFRAHLQARLCACKFGSRRRRCHRCFV